MAAYIDLNPVRADIVSDPKDYRWCGYGAAVAGVKAERTGLGIVAGAARVPSGGSERGAGGERSARPLATAALSGALLCRWPGAGNEVFRERSLRRAARTFRTETRQRSARSARARRGLAP
ncbi:MAG: hypothetical protein DVB27_00390 [Verrucomicrobia bacterium]|nr:MAG: hypothetical protein DVB27_00390 [Verrucomicrobiota bacterium]